MELKHYLAILWRRKWIIILTAALALVAATAGTRMITPSYEASVKVRMDPAGEVLDVGGVNYIEQLLKTYIQLVTSDSYRARAGQHLGIPIPASAHVNAELVPDTTVLQIMVEDENAGITANLANALATVLIEETNASRNGRLTPLTIIDAAEVPSGPSAPVLRMNMMLGLLAGLVAGVGLTFLFEHLDTKLYTTRQIQEVTELPTLAQIPSVTKKKRLMFQNGQSFQGEVYRQLRTRILTLDFEQPLKTIMVTSAEPNEGKSTIVCNLAFAMAQAGRRVAVVDGDLRRPTIHTLFGLRNDIGLSSVLNQQATLDEALQTAQVGLPGVAVSVLTSGGVPAYPAELLGTYNMATVIKQLTERFDTVLLDTPCFLAVTDATIVAPLVDGIVLVVGFAQARHEHVQAVRRQLADIRARMIGVVINRAEVSNSSYFYYHKK